METVQPITEKVKTFEEACAVLGIDPLEIHFPDDKPDEVAYKKLKVIAAALNEGWVPNWDNGSEEKWFPWFNMDSSSGFSFFGCDDWRSASGVGSRLCFKSSELATYAGKQFIKFYEQYFQIK